MEIFLSDLYPNDPGPSGATGPQGATGPIPANVVFTTGDQTISGLKDFTTRPTVNTIPVALSGEAASSIEQWVKNDSNTTLYKGQPVYVSGSNGNNILIYSASNTGERTSSKTFGLLKQDLLNNEQGYVVTEGPLFNVNTSMAIEGDPIWLGPTGNLIFGLANKPKAPEHLVYLGFVERAHQNQGKIFVKVQNGFELDELHDVRIVNKQNSDIIIYNSGSGLWLNSGVDFGSFYTNNNPSGFIDNQDIVFSGIQNELYKKQNNSTAFSFENVSFPTQTVTLTGLENKYYLINPETVGRILLLSTSGLKTGSACIIRNVSTVIGPDVNVKISGINTNNNVFALPSPLNTSQKNEALKYYIFNGTGFQAEYVNYHTHTAESIDGLITLLGEKPTAKFVSNLQLGQTLYWTASSANWLNSFLNGGDIKTWMLLTEKADFKLENSSSKRAWGDRIHFYITKPLNNFLIDITDNIPQLQSQVPQNYRITNLTSSGWSFQYSGSSTLVQSLNIDPLQTADFTLTKPPIGGIGPIITNIQHYNLLPNSVVQTTGTQIISGLKYISGEYPPVAEYSVDDIRNSISGWGMFFDDGHRLQYYNVTPQGNNYQKLGPYTLTDLDNRVGLLEGAVTVTTTSNALNFTTLFNRTNSLLYPIILNYDSNFNIINDPIPENDKEKRFIIANSPTNITGIIASGNTTGFNIDVCQAGAGQVLITGSGEGITINSYNGFKTAGPSAVITLMHTGNNGYIMYGNTAV